ncbi:hypothetical protein CASFOL_007303 [Castilleja foliolosa]|uniref:RanBP2-type domain-containing protein n=1 Tax=Castilleja foliolosa TaxID=1961234 RepID=A0ABD3E8X2_9LAMI
MNRPGDWNCRSCQHLNFQRRDSCQRCGDPRPGERADYSGFPGRLGSPFMFTGPDVRPGDWYCAVSNCGAHNFASRSTCFKCGALKDDGAAAAAGFDGEFSRGGRGFGGGGGGGSRSGWKSGDWICANRDAMSTTLRAGWSALGAMHQGNSVANLHFNLSRFSIFVQELKSMRENQDLDTPDEAE